MYARVTTVQAQPGKADELVQFVRETVLPIAKQQHGFSGMFILADPANNKGMAITMWETEADMAAGEASDGYYTQQLAKAARYLAAPPVRETYEVRTKE
jgi:heme-degrading monooxygenase HmoA